MRRKLSRREIDRLENLLILLLVCLALFLIHRTGMFQSVTEQGSGTGDESLFAGVQDTALSRGTPVRLMVQNGTGRYGVQYDQTTVNRLYHDGLNDLLTQSLDTMASPQASSREAWERAVSQGSSWVYYDFLYNVSFTSQSSRGEGEARSFLITARNGRADALYYYNEETGDYYMAQLRETSLVLPALLEDLVPNGGQFAFENSSLADTLAPYMMLLPQPLLCPVYTGANPLDDWDTADQEALLEALDFNPRASAVYEAVDGTVIQEGSDTLRIQKNVKITFHAAESGQARFQALSAREKDLQIKAEEILDGVTAGHLGEGTMFCQSIETQEDGSVALVFCYLLNGTQVQLWEEGWSARFLFEGSDCTAFSVCLREYTLTERSQQALPERQAAAAAVAMGQTGKELQLCYLDNGTTPEIAADWTVRERT